MVSEKNKTIEKIMKEFDEVLTILERIRKKVVQMRNEIIDNTFEKHCIKMGLGIYAGMLRDFKADLKILKEEIKTAYEWEEKSKKK